ncbi:hypothetical protein KJ784_00535, partial [Patescibacteria group bacterium]|nr:hypothetical protein [Patescibacteria group bacterium]
MYNIMKKYGLQPPYFIYNEKKIKSNLLKFREMLPKNFDIYYSIKANPNHVILNIFRQLGVGAEISSGGELDLVKNAGFVTNRIIFTGPGKTTRELERAILSKIYLIIVESLNEIKRINKIASKLKIKQKILIRINPLIFCAQPDSMFPMIGGGQKFGIDEEEILNLIKAILLFENIDISGFHFFTGSNIFDEQVIINNTEHLFKLVNSYELFFKRKFSIIDIGGGLALNYSQENNKHFDIKKLTKGLSFLVEKYNLKDKNIIIESGRFLVGESGEYIVEVVDVKISRGETFVIINGGVNHISRATLAKNGHEI